MKSHFFVALFAATLVASFAHCQTVLFSDSFDRVEGFNDDPDNLTNFSDWGMNDNEFGGVITQAYTMDTSRPGGAQNTTDGEFGILRNSAAQINTDFSQFAPLGYTVEFDFVRTGGVGFVTLGVGLDPNEIPSRMGFNSNVFLFDQIDTVDGAVLFQQDNDNEGNGRVQVFNASESILSEPNAFFDNEEPHSAIISILTPNGYGDGAIADVLVIVDGNNPISSTITFDGENSGYLALYSNQTGATVDNLIIRAIDPDDTRSCDFDGNGRCDLVDLDELLYEGQSTQTNRYDLNGDGTVDLLDRNALLVEFDRADDSVGSLPGDATLSGKTDAVDLNEVGLRWQNVATSYSQGDFNGDGFVDAADLNDLGVYWQQTAADFADQAPATVPEPRAGALVLFGLAIVSLRRQRIA